MSKTRFFLTLSSLALLAACNAGADVTIDVDADSSSSVAASSAPFLDDEDSSSSDGVVIDVSGSAAVDVSAPRVITINVTDWSFSPTMIAAKKGEKVQLKLVGGTGIHSFAVPELSMNVRVAAGEIVTVDLPTDTVGSFGASCRIPCGEGHKEMKATVVISE